MQTFDADASGTLDFEEFVDMMAVPMASATDPAMVVQRKKFVSQRLREAGIGAQRSIAVKRILAGVDPSVSIVSSSSGGDDALHAAMTAPSKKAGAFECLFISLYRMTEYFTNISCYYFNEYFLMHLSLLMKVSAATAPAFTKNELLRDLFQIFDEDGGGDLDGDEVVMLLEAFGRNAVDAAATISTFDLDNSGTIDFKEFVAMVAVPMGGTLCPLRALLSLLTAQSLLVLSLYITLSRITAHSLLALSLPRSLSTVKI